MSTVITHKQFPNERTYEMDLCGRPLKINMGKVAELATASAMVTLSNPTPNTFTRMGSPRHTPGKSPGEGPAAGDSGFFRRDLI